MDKKTTIRALQIAVLIALPVLVAAHSNVPPAGYAGVPGENGTSAGCHQITAGTGNVQVTFPHAATYTPEAPQTVQAVVTDAVASRWGFEVSAQLAGNTATQAGTFVPTDNNAVVAASLMDLSGLATQLVAVPFLQPAAISTGRSTRSNSAA